MIRVPARDISGLVETQPLVAIDLLIDEIAKAKHAKLSLSKLNLVFLFCAAIMNSLGADRVGLRGQNPVKAIFDPGLSRQSQRFIAICLLRLLSANDERFQEDSEFRVQAFKLFDLVLAKDLYQLLSIAEQEQTFEKQRKLRDATPAAQTTMTEVIASLRNLSVLSNYRQTYMQRLNSGPVKALVWPFLPRELLEVRLDELFKLIEECVEERGSKKLQAFERAKDALDEFKRDAARHGTRYSLEFLSAFATRLSALLQDHFQQSAFGKPGKLIVEPAKRKYPFHQQGREVRLVLVVLNDGPGFAFDASLEVMTGVELGVAALYLGTIEPGFITVEVPYLVASPQRAIEVVGTVKWSNFDGSSQKSEFYFPLEGQAWDLDWEQLSKEDPYSLEPVASAEDLVGRTEILNQLVALAQARSVGSAYLFGQKRVGKTSIVKALAMILSKKVTRDYFVLYLDGGDYVHPDAERTIEILGRRVCREIQQADVKFAQLTVPNFGRSLVPLVEFLESVSKIAPQFRILVILDEFDELPI